MFLKPVALIITILIKGTELRGKQTSRNCFSLMTEPISPLLVTASILETQQRFRYIWMDGCLTNRWLDRIISEPQPQFVPGEILVFQQQDELPELTLVLLHQGVATNLEEEPNQKRLLTVSKNSDPKYLGT